MGFGQDIGCIDPWAWTALHVPYYPRYPGCVSRRPLPRMPPAASPFASAVLQQEGLPPEGITAAGARLLRLTIQNARSHGPLESRGGSTISYPFSSISRRSSLAPRPAVVR